MAITLPQLTEAINPAHTAILFGAGATAPSGAPTGAQLARRLWKDVAKSEPASDDLIETSSILARRHGRRAVIDSVVATLKPLQPSGGLLGIPQFPWRALFSTNFDTLIEKAYKQADQILTPIRSNYDLTYREDRSGTTLFKIHGCITQDRSLGDKPSMILTEQDYEDFLEYRQSIFANFTNHLFGGDVLIIGQSLRDQHLNKSVKDALNAKDQGAPNQVYVLVYDQDDLRAPLLEDVVPRYASVVLTRLFIPWPTSRKTRVHRSRWEHRFFL